VTAKTGTTRSSGITSFGYFTTSASLWIEEEIYMSVETKKNEE
jgi:hypothetical protein